MGQQVIKIPIEMFDISRIGAADLNIFFGLDPPGQSAKFPLSTDIGTGSNDHHQSFFSSYTDELGDIQVTGKIILSGVFFMHIPGTIRFYTVTAHSQHLFKDITPGIRHISEIMNSTGNELHRLSVFYKLITNNFKCHKVTTFR